MCVLPPYSRSTFGFKNWSLFLIVIFLVFFMSMCVHAFRRGVGKRGSGV